MKLDDIKYLVSNSSIMVVVLDQDLRYVYVNNAHFKVSGLTKEQALGKTNAEIFGESFSRSWDDADRRALSTDRYIIEPNEWRDRTGTLRKFISTRMRVTIDDAPHVIAIVSEIKGNSPSDFEHAQADLNGIIISVQVLKGKLSEQN